MTHCRACIKVGEEDEVVCGARDCRHYYPRVASGGQVDISRQHLEDVIADIEDLVSRPPEVKKEEEEEARPAVRAPVLERVAKRQEQMRAPPKNYSEEEKNLRLHPLMRFTKRATKRASSTPKVTVASIIKARKSVVVPKGESAFV